MRDWQGKQSDIRDFNSSVTSSEADATNKAKPEAGENEPFRYAYSCVWFQFMTQQRLCTLSGPVKCIIIAYTYSVTTFAHFRHLPISTFGRADVLLKYSINISLIFSII